MSRSIIFILFCLFFNTYSGTSQESFNSVYQAFIQKHVINNRVSYELIDSLEVAKVEAQLSSVVFDVLNKSEKKQHLINAYNFKVIASIMDHFPTESVTNVAYFFTKERKIGNLNISLNDLESLIIETTNKPLDHLLLNCGALSCPNLIFYNGIDDKVFYESALKNPEILRLDEESQTLFLSKIFYWNKDDFGNNSQLLERLQDYIPETDISNFKIDYLDYDWTLNSQKGQDVLLYYPTKLYGKGAGEIKVFNNYYTQTDNGFRSNFFSSFIQVLVGTSKNVNLGFDIKVRSVNQGNVGLFSALAFKDQKIDPLSSIYTFSRTGISGIGPRIKYQPFKSKGNINFLHAIYFVPMQDAQGNSDYGYSDFNNLQIFNNMFYEIELSVKKRLFFDVGFLIENLRLGVQRNFDHFTQLQFPITGIYNYYPNPNTTYYGLVNVAARTVFTYAPDTDTRVNLNGYMQVGLGAKHYITENIELEGLYTYFVDGTAGRQAHTFNIGFRIFRFN